ncbi:actin-like protein 9 [Sorex fumeus]|uniref:actin-like protein 9 n=1 Tax=Sorex fumeus TaxID=62283 RepID=UPI0024ACBD63|nr:actin-like protein 9 [Sorex fumeus]
MDTHLSKFPVSQPCSETPKASVIPHSILVNKTLPRETSSVVSCETLSQTGAVVIDMGTGTCKVGFAGQARPMYTVETLVGCQPKKLATAGPPVLETFIGNAARSRPELALVQPLRNGIVVDWEAAELIWRHLLEHDLRVAPRDHPLLFSDPPFSPATNREKLVEVAFEALCSPAMYVESQSVLAVYAHGRISGLVVDSGHGVTYTVPVFQGYNLVHATQRLDLAGTHLTAFLADKMLLGSGLPFSQRHLDTVEHIKHHYCYVVDDFQKAQARPVQDCCQTFKLPDGRSVTLNQELYQCPELLFRPPEIPGLAPVGLPAMTQQALQKVPPEARPEVARNVLLCGGSSLFPGFHSRFQAELQRAGAASDTHVVAGTSRHLAVWIGGSILASLRAFQSCWVLKEQYEEQGPHIVYRKCY